MTLSNFTPFSNRVQQLLKRNLTTTAKVLAVSLAMLLHILQSPAGYAQTTTIPLSYTSEVVSPCLNCTAEDIKAVDFWLKGYGPDESSNCLDSGTILSTGNKMIVKLSVTASQRYGLVMVANIHIDSSGNGLQANTFYKAFKFCSNRTYVQGPAYDTISLDPLVKLKAGWRITIKDVFVAWDNSDFNKGNNKFPPCAGIDVSGGTITNWDCKALQGNALTPHCKKQSEVFIIKVPTKPTLHPNPVCTPVTCPNGSNGAIDISVGPWFQVGDYTYVWSKTGDLSFQQTTQDASGLTAGTYNVRIYASPTCYKDSNGINVSTLPPITFTKDSANVDCKDSATGRARVSITGGTGPFTYSWYPSAVSHVPYPNRDSAYGLIAGTYRDTIRDNNKCYVVATFEIKQPAQALKIDYFTIHRIVNCGEGAVGKVSVHPSGGWRKTAKPYYSYIWRDGSNNIIAGATEDTLPNRLAGVYSVTVTDSLGCSVSKDTTIPIVECPPPPVSGEVFCTKSQGYFGTDNPGKATYYNGLSGALCSPTQSETRATLKNSLLYWKTVKAPAPDRDSLKIGKVNLTALCIDDAGYTAAINQILDYLPGGGPITTYPGTSLPPAYDPAGKAIPGNTLIAQTLALGLNIGLNKNLDSFKLGNSLITEKVSGPCGTSSGYGYKDTFNTAVFAGKYVIQVFHEASAAIVNGSPNAQALASIAELLNVAFEDCRAADTSNLVYTGGSGECSSTAGKTLTNSESLQLFQLKAYPNPFTSSVTIGFKAPASGNATLEIFDVNGRRLELLNKGRMQAGQFTSFEYRPAVKVPGQLFYKITVGAYSVNGKLMNKQ